VWDYSEHRTCRTRATVPPIRILLRKKRGALAIFMFGSRRRPFYALSRVAHQWIYLRSQKEAHAKDHDHNSLSRVSSLFGF
jgi:hypothetical protein